MESGVNDLHVFGALLLWDVKLGKNHVVLIFWMIHGGANGCDDARVEELGFMDLNLG